VQYDAIKSNTILMGMTPTLHSLGKIMAKIGYELLFVVVALIITFVAGGYLRPATINMELSPNGAGQSGWPLPYAASYWEDMGMKSYQAERFSFKSFAADVGLFYLGIRLVMFVATRKRSG